MNVLLLAIFLLALRFVSLFLLIVVVRRQWKLLRAHTDPDVSHVRGILLGLGVAGMVGQLIPIAIDISAIKNFDGNQTVGGLLAFYALSNAITSVVASFLLWYMYYLIERQNLRLKEGENAPKTKTRR